MFLSRYQVKELTGTADREKQVECLKSNRIPFTLDVFWRPVVTICAIEGRSAIRDEDHKFLTRDQVKELTGTASRNKQAECLKSNRIPFTFDILGRPVVTISAIEGRAAIKAEEPKQGWQGPSFLRAA